MHILIKSLNINNFKGVLKSEIIFSESTIIKGDNATGKTTIFDAFTWLLFGKDSSDRKDFNIKNTVRTDLNRNDHEVEGHLVVNGVDFLLKRTYREKWQKKKGSPEAEFTGHETIFSVNDVPCSQKEFQAKVDAICGEDLFKLITNPLYFPSLKWQSQREILFGMAGEVRDSDIAGTNEAFLKLLASLTGKSLDEYKREITAKKKRIKDELDFIPGRIDEVNRNMPLAADFGVISIQLGHKESDLKNIEAQIADISLAAKAQYDAKQVLQSEMYQLKTEQQKLTQEAKAKLDEQAFMAGAEKRNLVSRLRDIESQFKSKEQRINDVKTSINMLSQKREDLIKQWHQHNDKVLTFDEKDFCCPTCKRAFEMADIESKQAEMTSNFNLHKSDALAKINGDGMKIKSQIETEKALQTSIEAELNGLNLELNQVKAQLASLPEQSGVATPMPAVVEGVVELEEKIIALQKRIDEPINVQSDSELKETKAQLTAEIDTLKKKLYEKDLIEKSNQRITELKEQQRTMANEIAYLEGLEFTIMEFTKAKIETIEAKVNSLFEVVKFKLFETQINGQEVETCVATVNGVPYPDLNNAMKINGGLDIIKTICRYRDVYAPVFIDNAEAVTDVTPLPTQSIQLVVSKQELEIINN